LNVAPDHRLHERREVLRCCLDRLPDFRFEVRRICGIGVQFRGPPRDILAGNTVTLILKDLSTGTRKSLSEFIAFSACPHRDPSRST
jgi:hypothetical protein